jgi:hypothetical protein
MDAHSPAFLEARVEEPIARASLIIGLYGSRFVRSSSEADNAAVIDGLAVRDGARAGASWSVISAMSNSRFATSRSDAWTSDASSGGSSQNSTQEPNGFLLATMACKYTS